MRSDSSSTACTCLRYVDESGRPTGEPIALSRCETHPPGSRFKVWATGLNNWHIHAKHPTTGAWIAAHGLYSETAAMLKGDSFCNKLDAEAERAAA